MPGRNHKLINNEIYHVFNKTIDRKHILEEDGISQQFFDRAQYYRSSQSIMRFSNFIKISAQLKRNYFKKILDKRTFRINVLAYCFMPTHYHFLLKQNHEKGISTFISQIQNSFTKYFNILNNRKGPIFLHRFKSKPIQNEEQSKHVSRYIHLNPFSDEFILDKNDLLNYSWSSLYEFLNPSFYSLSQPGYILSLFNNDIKRYVKFVLDNAQYQRTLEYCKYSNKW